MTSLTDQETKNNCKPIVTEYNDMFLRKARGSHCDSLLTVYITAGTSKEDALAFIQERYVVNEIYMRNPAVQFLADNYKRKHKCLLLAMNAVERRIDIPATGLVLYTGRTWNRNMRTVMIEQVPIKPITEMMHDFFNYHFDVWSDDD